MTVAVSLSPDAKQRLLSKAKSEGVDLPTLVTRLLEAEAQRIGSSEQHAGENQATRELFEKWAKEESEMGPEELAQGEREFRELMEGMNQARVDCEGPNSRKIFP